MRRLLNTLYVTSDGAYARKDGLNVVVEVEGEERLRAPVHLLGSLVLFGHVSVSPALMGALAEAGITVAFFGHNGRFLARVEGPVSGNVLLRREQYRRADDPEACAAVVRAVVAAKALNQRAVLQRVLRDHAASLGPAACSAVEDAQARMRDLARYAAFESDLDRLRGFEGEAASRYFSVFGHAVLGADPALGFRGRGRRPPLDPMNALLSSYTRCSCTIAVRHSRARASIRPQVSCTGYGRAGRA